MTVTRIGFAYNPTNADATELAERAAGWCQVHGIDHWTLQADDMAHQLAELPTTDVVFVLGGDGTFLRAMRGVAEVDVPILGINLGKVGFLSKAEASELESVLALVVAGDYRIDERMALEGRVLRRGTPIDPDRHVALNDIVVARGSLARVCRLDVSIDGTHLATFLTPIAAYLSAFRSVVVGPRQVVRCTVVDAYEALVSIDGREDVPLQVGDVVEVRAVDRPIRLVEPAGALSYWDLLRHKVELLPS